MLFALSNPRPVPCNGRSQLQIVLCFSHDVVQKRSNASSFCLSANISTDETFNCPLNPWLLYLKSWVEYFNTNINYYLQYCNINVSNGYTVTFLLVTKEWPKIILKFWSCWREKNSTIKRSQLACTFYVAGNYHLVIVFDGKWRRYCLHSQKKSMSLIGDCKMSCRFKSPAYYSLFFSIRSSYWVSVWLNYSFIFY